jgi:transposase
VQVEVTRVLFGLDEFRVLDAELVDGAVHVAIETIRVEGACPACGVFSARVKQRPVVRVRDDISFGRRVVLWWCKRRFRCAEPACEQLSFTETTTAIAARARLSGRLRDAIYAAVKTRSVAEVAAEHGVSWRTAWRAAQIRIRAGLAARASGPPRRLGLDETTFRRPQRYATGFVDLETGKLADLLEGRSKQLVADWLDGLGDAKDAIVDVVIDPFAGYNAAVRDTITDARRTVDRFHVVKLANQVITDVRCRRNQELTGHRGRKHDPLYGARRDLTRGAERLTERGRERIARAFAADTSLELECVWMAKETLRDVYEIRDGHQAHLALVRWYQLVVDFDIAELTTFAETISRWEGEFLNYFDSRLTNGRTEGRNLIIKAVKRTGFGFTNFDNYRLRVLYRCT